MLRRLLGKVDDGRFGRALAGMQAGWQWQCDVRQDGLVEGYVKHGSKQYMVVIERRGRGGSAVRLRGWSRQAARYCICRHVRAGWQRRRVRAQALQAGAPRRLLVAAVSRSGTGAAAPEGNSRGRSCGPAERYAVNAVQPLTERFGLLVTWDFMETLLIPGPQLRPWYSCKPPGC